MENQVMALKEKGIAAEFLSSTQTSQVRNKIHEDLDSGKPSVRMLYVTPELIATPGFMSKLKKIHGRGFLNLIAIDEANKNDKNAVSETLRESTKQRLLSALKQAEEWLGDLSIEFEESASFLENERYKKYGKSGKTFYYSQVASTVRWITMTSVKELRNWLSNITSHPPPPSPFTENSVLEEETPEMLSPLLEKKPKRTADLELCCSIGSETTTSIPTSESSKLPAIPSFSEFANSKKAIDDNSSCNAKLDLLIV